MSTINLTEREIETLRVAVSHLGKLELTRLGERTILGDRDGTERARSAYRLTQDLWSRLYRLQYAREPPTFTG